GQFLLDDDLLVTHNRLIQAPDGLVRFWFAAEATDYWPLTNSGFWLEWRLCGMNPAGYHVTSVALHFAEAFLIWVILARLSIPGSYLAALLFALHPVNVESVAWISQQKNVFALLFLLLSIFWFINAQVERLQSRFGNMPEPHLPDRQFTMNRWYWLSLVSFLAAMLSKGSTAVLPVLLLLIVWWMHGRVSWSSYVRLAPFILVALVLSIVNVWFQTHG